MSARTRGSSVGAFRRLVPVAGWLPRYERRWLRGDILAGVAVTAMIVPKDLGYAGIAGVPVQNGLYAAAAGAILYALFCTSRQISTGPSSSLAAVAGSAVLAPASAASKRRSWWRPSRSSPGCLFLLLGVFRMGWISQFLSKAVVTGFLAGAAVQVVIGELPKLTGTSADGDSSWRELALVDPRPGRHPLDVGRRGRCLARGDPRVAIRGTEGSRSVGARGRRPARVAHVRSRRARRGARGTRAARVAGPADPEPSISSRDHFAQIAIASVALLLIGFSQTAGDARVFATRHRYRIDVNQESVAQGMANVGAGVFQGMPVSTSLSASSLNESSGATTPVASLTTGAARPGDAGLARTAVLGSAQSGTRRDHHRRGRVRDDRHPGVASPAPRGAIRLLDCRGRNPRACSRRACSPASSSGSCSRSDGLCTSRRVRRCRSSDAKRARRFSGTSTTTPTTRPSPTSPVLRLDGGLFFATAEALDDRIRGLAEHDRPPHALVLDLEGVNFIDSQGAAKLTEIQAFAETRSITLRLARVKPHVLAVLQSEGFLDRIGADHIHGNVHRAVEAQLDDHTSQHEVPDGG